MKIHRVLKSPWNFSFLTRAGVAEHSHTAAQHKAGKDTGSRPLKVPFLSSWKLCHPCDFQAAPTLSLQLCSLGVKWTVLHEQSPNSTPLPCPFPPAQHTCLSQNLSFPFPGWTGLQAEADRPLGHSRLILSSRHPSPYSPSHSHRVSRTTPGQACPWDAQSGARLSNQPGAL